MEIKSKYCCISTANLTPKQRDPESHNFTEAIRPYNIRCIKCVLGLVEEGSRLREAWHRGSAEIL